MCYCTSKFRDTSHFNWFIESTYRRSKMIKNHNLALWRCLLIWTCCSWGQNISLCNVSKIIHRDQTRDTANNYGFYQIFSLFILWLESYHSVIKIESQWGSKTFEMMKFKNLESFWQISKVFRPWSKTSKLYLSKVFDFHPNLHQVRQTSFGHETLYTKAQMFQNKSLSNYQSSKTWCFILVESSKVSEILKKLV